MAISQSAQGERVAEGGIIMQAASEPNFSKSVAVEIDLHVLGSHLADLDAAAVLAANPSGFARVWGMMPNAAGHSQRLWSRLAPGDVVLFTKARTITAVGRLSAKAVSSDLSRHLWGSSRDGRTWELLFFIDRYRPTDIALADFNQAVGYRPAFFPQTTIPVPKEKANAARQFLQSFSVFPCAP